MIVFSVTSLVPNPAVGQRIAELWPSNYLKLSDTSWLVAGSGTAQELSDAMGVTRGDFSGVVIFSTTGYYGRAPNNIWEWIAAKLEAPADA